ncbi:unnamed protein product, partial [Gulo gulo]
GKQKSGSFRVHTELVWQIRNARTPKCMVKFFQKDIFLILGLCTGGWGSRQGLGKGIGKYSIILKETKSR